MFNRQFFSSLWWASKIALAVIVAGFFLRNLRQAIFLPNRELQYYQTIKKDLTTPNFKGYSSSQVLLKDPFQVVALSDMAVGLMNLSHKGTVPNAELLPLIDEIKNRALSPAVSPYPELAAQTDLTTGGVRGLYLSHLNLILGIDQYLHAAPQPDPLQTAITKVLHDQSSAEHHFHVSSFADGSQWPADQSVTLLSLYLYDQLNQTHYSDQPIQDWLAFMKNEMTDSETGLYKSALAARWYKDIPRGNSLSWTIFYMAQFAPKEAALLYSRYREKMAIEVAGVGGFREWPKGKADRMTSDTGPVIAGFGTAATALGIGPTNLMHDRQQHDLIMRLFWLTGVPHYAPLIGQAILFSGETATYWFKDKSPNSYLASDLKQLTSFEVLTNSGVFMFVIFGAIAIVICGTLLFGDVVVRRVIKKRKS